MKIVYSQLKKLLPKLTSDYLKLRNDLTLVGHFTSSMEKLDDEVVYDLEIRQNRADCLGYFGLARDLSVYYQIPLITPTSHIPPITSNYQLPIKVTATDYVKRIQAIRISNLKNTPSPSWLSQFLQLHQINSINTLVDLTNYVMFIYGLPNHAFDTSKSTDRLVWETNQRYSQFTTLDGTTLKLGPEILMVNNPSQPLSLSFLGGQSCAIDIGTTETIIEMAVYDRTKVRNDYRQLKTVTEAAIRLDKDLDSNLIPQAFNYLISLILQYCQGQITSQLYDYYPEPITSPIIPFDPAKPGSYAGITISSDFSLNTLDRLGCQLTPDGTAYLITPPSIRKDINIEEDLIEEVIRFFGYDRIPRHEPISSSPLPDITPKILYLAEQLKDQLVSLGYDEIRSWPLTTQSLDPQTVIATQNSINSEYPYLRQSIIQSLQNQYHQYQRLKLFDQKFFEIGKIFSYQNNQYLESYALGISHYDQSQLAADLNRLFPHLSHPSIHSLSRQSFVEVTLASVDAPNSYHPSSQQNSAYELNSQIITLDANLNLDSPESPSKLLADYARQIGDEHLWQIVISDIYTDPKTGQIRYTFRVSYFNCDDKTAKAIHQKVFHQA
jgi:phenylalanyl-tRNA synthetase beta chain